MIDMQPTPALITTQEITPANEQAIMNNYVDLDMTRIKQTCPFCVDGRCGHRHQKDTEVTGYYPQALGGSLNIAVVEWILNNNNEDFTSSKNATFKKLEALSYALGVHNDDHASHDVEGKKSGCGFADNLTTIIDRLHDKQSDIWEIITSVAPGLETQQQLWQEVITTLQSLNKKTVPSGKKIVDESISQGAALQEITGDHKELIAVVNLKTGTTLNVDNNQDHQAFNLDAWYVLMQAEDLGIDQQKALLLTLGLYVATEMVLVEDKKNVRLPVRVLS